MASQLLDLAGTGALARPATLRERLRAWQINRQRQRRIARELASYTQRDLCDLGISSGDIPEIIRGTYRR